MNFSIVNALHSPLLNNNDVFDAKKILFNIYSSEEEPLIVEEMEAAMKGMLEPVYEEKTLGTAEVRQLFKFSK